MFLFYKGTCDYLNHAYTTTTFIFDTLCTIYVLDLSLNNFFSIITKSALLRILIILIILIYMLCNCIFIDSSMILKILSSLIILLLVITYIITNNKQQFIVNLAFILFFWWMFSYLISFISMEFFICFMINYDLIELDILNIHISEHLSNVLDSVFSDLDKQTSPILSKYNHNGGPNNGGPNGIFYFNDYHGDDEDNGGYDVVNSIREYYSNPFWQLSKKYFDFAGSKYITDGYNSTLDFNKTNLHAILINELSDENMCDFFKSFSVYRSNLEKYNSVIKLQDLCLWEHDVLTKAKFFHENFNILSSYQSKYESAYNYWLNRQVQHVSFFNLVSNNFFMINFIDRDLYYKEICKDLIWVKLNLILSDSFLSDDRPVTIKILKFDDIMGKITQSLSSEYKQALNCSSDLYKWHLTNNANTTMVDFLGKHYLSREIYIWDTINISNKTGLGLSHKFAYPNFHAYTKYI